MMLLIAICALGRRAWGGGDDDSGDNGGGGGNNSSPSETNYPNPDVVADVDLAAGQRDFNTTRFVDLRSPEDYAAAHIVGAVNADPARFGYGTNALPDKGAVEAVLREWGVSSDTTIILYDTETSDVTTWVFWVLDTYGQSVRLLNGGFIAWLNGDLSLVLDVPQISPSSYSLPNANGNRVADADWVNQHRGDSGVVVLDAREPEVYQGVGHIQGATNITGDLAYANGAVRESIEIENLFDDGAVNNASTIVVYDTDGTLGSLSYYVLRVLGKTVRLYAGGWTEWSSRGLPTATGVE